MKTVTRTAFSNIRANKSRNILTGIAIFLTTLLLFVIPGVGFGVVNLEFAAVNQVYPTFHGLYRDVSPQTAQNLKASDRLESMGLRCDPAVMVNETYTISMVYLDETCAELNKSEFVERFPELSLFYRLFSPLNSEMICIFPYFCPYAESAREIREIFS